MEDAVNAYAADIASAAPKAFTVGQQATLRAHARDVYTAGNRVLDNLGNPTEFAKATQEYEAAALKVRDYVKSVNPNVTNLPAVEAELQRKATQLMEFRNGAEVLSLYKEAGQEGGFNPVKLHDILRTRYLGTQNPAMTESGKVLGQGQSLLDIPEGGVGQQQPSLMGMLTEYAKSKVPGGRFLPTIGKAEVTPGVMPWQTPMDVNSPTARMGAQLTGQGTIRSLEQTSMDLQNQATQRNQQQKDAVKQFTKP
jgi:hypothetical protein